MTDKADELMKNTLERMSRRSSSVLGVMDAFSLTTDIMAGDTPINKVAGITLADERKLPHMLKDFLCHEDHYSAYEHVGALLVHCYRRLYTKNIDRYIDYCMTVPLSLNRQVGPCETIFRMFWYILPTLIPYVLTPIALTLFAAAEKQPPLGSSH